MSHGSFSIFFVLRLEKKKVNCLLRGPGKRQKSRDLKQKLARRDEGTCTWSRGAGSGQAGTGKRVKRVEDKEELRSNSN